MAQMLRNIVRYGGGLKSLAVPVQQQSVGLRTTGVRSLWHMSKASAVSKCHSCGCGLGGSCTCGSQKRFASTNGKLHIFLINNFTFAFIPALEHNLNFAVVRRISVGWNPSNRIPIWNCILGEKALLEFLQEEIENEKKTLAGHLPSEVDGFQIKFDSAEVELSKQASNEKWVQIVTWSRRNTAEIVMFSCPLKNVRILIKFNVNHTVDEQNFDDDFQDESERGQDQRQEKQEPAKMLSTPNFEVDIVKGDTTLSMTCSYINTPATEGEYGNWYGGSLTIFSLFIGKI